MGWRLGISLIDEASKSHHYTWSTDIVIPSGRFLSIVLPPDKEVTILDGCTLTVENDADLLIFSL